MKNNKSLIWALVGLLIIVIVGVYVYQTDPFAEQDATETAQQGEATSQPAATGDEEKTAAAQPQNNESGSETASGDAAEVGAPTFDVVRVEPDGSTLIAGQAMPGAQVEIVSGGQVIAKADAGAGGDFVAVVDEALEPGDHEIVLRAVGEGSASAQSEEVATISVPKDDPAELLVMVTKPGEASRILTRPESATDDQETVAAAAASGETQQGGDAGTGVAEKTVQSRSETQTATEAPKQEPETKTAMAEDTAGEHVATAPKGGGASQSDGEETAAAASSDNGNAQTAGSAEISEAPKTGAETTAAPAEEAESEVAMAPTDNTAQESEAEKSNAVAAVPQTTLRIDAVEIEDGRIFVAGSSTPGGEVRVYADGEPIGSSTVSASGRFLVEANKDLAVGDHVIGADLIMQAGDAPSLRVAVPFTRPEGQMVAAVASEKPEESAGAAGQASGSTGEAGDSAAVETADAPTEEPAEETNSAAADQSAEQPSNQQVAETGSDQRAETADNATTETKETAAQTEPAPTTDTAQADTQSQVIEQGSADDSTAGASESTDQSNVVASAEPRDDATPTVVQPALEPRDSSVIIRRGDTLWQISRRIYGRGVRYTTIYLANTDQIRNPDKIEPGQIFMVPDEPLENAEELHRQRIRGR